MTLLEYLNTLKMIELKDICRDSSINGISRLKKSQLIDIMVECELKGIPEEFEKEKTYLLPIPEESAACCHGSDDPLCDECDPIILHLPIKPDALKVHKDKWLNMFKKGKEILKKNKL
tara:strand:- start:150 stop:503 length:354 start_codon:yes stop_codon:yes gene_type:complete